MSQVHFGPSPKIPRFLVWKASLTLCIYPMAIVVPLVSDLTGLDNYNLSGQSNFNKTTVDLINTFLSSLPSPVCLTAHNGNAYNFPLLTAELTKIRTQLNPDVLCVDSLPGMKEISGKITDNESVKRKSLVLMQKLMLQQNYSKQECLKQG